MAAELDFLAHLARESARFAQAIGDAQPMALVPSCPGWNADDLLWHLGEVQWFWGTVVRERLTGDQAEARKPPRPGDRAGLAAFYQRASSDLGEILAAAAPDTPAWTWSPDQTVGFIRRRQAHEALIHRVDAELTAGDRTPMDPGLSADGVDEALRVMYGGVPGWGTFTPDPGSTLRLGASDTGDSWLVTLGRFTGTDPDDGIHYDEPDIHPAGSDPGGPAAAEVRGSAADLDCWLWHRPAFAPVTSAGDHEVLSRFASAIGPGIR
ncbi:MAG TPA: maleylpyruvate isomerase family mycothiol-dependent enzyme [Streptosporangiaceae bacterium]|nr:maleylpyruvate isomerase family mycothiol-dependent enzyme [Streptosporangiaceae bacterium]